MAIQYWIERFDPACDRYRDTVTRKRIDAARNAAYDMARDIVASWAGLDTKWGWQFMREVMACPMIPGESYTFKIHHGDELRIYVDRV